MFSFPMPSLSRYVGRMPAPAEGMPVGPYSGTETILLVDDEPAVLALFAASLTRAGYDVIQARNGAEAVTAFEKDADRIQLLLTDLNMPYLNGSDLAKQLVARRPDLKLLYISGYATGAPGPDAAFLAKPFVREDLLKTVRRVLDGPA